VNAVCSRLVTEFAFELDASPEVEVIEEERTRLLFAEVLSTIVDDADARDGFQAVFSCAELAEEMGATKAMLIWKIDGKPLAPEQGPVRIVVLTDKEASRSVYGVEKLEVIDLRSRRPTSAPR
jgi:DMSO/TMAO reductase YedYZ molybdopterin-dependent catalytic subunit